MCAHVGVRVSEPARTPLLALCTLERRPHALSPWPCRVCDSQVLWTLFLWKCLDFEGCFPKINRKFFSYKLLVSKTLFATQNSGLPREHAVPGGLPVTQLGVSRGRRRTGRHRSCLVVKVGTEATGLTHTEVCVLMAS